MRTCTGFIVLAVALLTVPAHAQEPAPTQPVAETPSVTGTVVLLRPGTVILRTDDNRYFVFAIDSDTMRPAKLAPGSRVRVAYEQPTGPDDVRYATSIALSGPQPAAPAPVAEDEIPPEVRELERQVARTTRKYGIGIRAGVGLDPEVISFGAHATLGPIFSRRLYARPNVEFAFGELTTLFAVNLEAIYRLTPRLSRTRWSPYAGGGPTLGFSHRGFEEFDDEGRSFDFGDFDFNGGVHLLAGVEKATGTFIELKATIYTDPTFRLLFGYTF